MPGITTLWQRIIAALRPGAARRGSDRRAGAAGLALALAIAALILSWLALPAPSPIPAPVAGAWAQTPGAAASAGSADRPGAAAASAAVVLEVQDAIGPASADYIVRGIESAAASGAPLVVLRIDTPGGLDTSMRQIVQAILASEVPVAVYVSPSGARAASAGTYILYAAHIAAMAPATTLGAATPVAIGMPGAPGRGAGERDRGAPRSGDDADRKDAEPSAKPADGGGADSAKDSGVPGDAMTRKQVNDAAAFIRGLAQLRGRNAEWAERAVREAVTLTAEEARKENVIDVVARDVPDLLAQIDGRTVRLGTVEAQLRTAGVGHQAVPPDWRHRLLSVIANPSVALLLMMIGFYGLIIEFSSPGFGVAGVVGAICLILALFSLQLLPVNYAGLALIVLGLGLLVAELFTPSFGVLGLGGLAAFVAGGVLLFDRDVPGFEVPLVLVLSLAASSALIILVGGGLALRARRRPVVGGMESMIGLRGEVVDVIDGQAWAIVAGERWKVRGRDELRPGQEIRVRASRGLVLDVQVEPQHSPIRGEPR